MTSGTREGERSNLRSYVFFDSSFIRALQPDSLLLGRLSDLVAEGNVELRIPWLVAREVETGIGRSIPTTEIRNMRSAVRWISEATENAWAKDASGNIERVLKGREELVAAGFRSWIKKLNAVVTTPSNHMQSVFERYFSGSPPFSSPKNRKDIPDAFIFEEVRHFAEEVGRQIYALAHDSKLVQSLRDLPLVIVHNSLAGLIEDLSKPLEEWEQELRGYCERNEEVIKSALSDRLGDAICGETVRSKSLPSDDQEASVSAFGPISDVEFEIARLTALGPRLALLPVEYRVAEALVDLFVFRGDFYVLDESEQARFGIADPDWNEHYMHVQTHMNIRVRADIAILLEAESGGLKLRQADIHSIDVEPDDE